MAGQVGRYILEWRKSGKRKVAAVLNWRRKVVALGEWRVELCGGGKPVENQLKMP